MSWRSDWTQSVSRAGQQKPLQPRSSGLVANMLIMIMLEGDVA